MVIIADDDKTRLALIKGALKNINIETKVVSSGFELTSSLYENSVKIVIIDSSIVWLNVFDFILEARNSDKFPSIKFICIINGGNLKEKSIAENNSIEYLVSPLRINDIAKMVSKYI